ncbi:hypothetical protein [Sphingomonas fennica]|uniref:hypothetical protein n=1 Tax=Edaphosphingomonas fennica TaxID=114404 RepID=UPI0011B23E5C|nr:hypothetical protein [Sphingomonas fennica]
MIARVACLLRPLRDSIDRCLARSHLFPSARRKSGKRNRWQRDDGRIPSHQVAGTSEIAAPGYHHDWHSAVHVLIQANPLITSDELGLLSQHGLEYIYPDAILSTVFDDGDFIVSYKDIDKTCESIARICPDDAEAYRRFAQQAAALIPLMVQGMFVPPPPQGMFWSLLDQSTEGRTLMHIMQKSMLDIVNEHFTHDKTKIHLMRSAAELLVNPDDKGSRRRGSGRCRYRR